MSDSVQGKPWNNSDIETRNGISYGIQNGTRKEEIIMVLIYM